MQTEVNNKPLAKKIVRILLKTILFLLLFVVVIFLLVLTPPVQKFLTGRAEAFLENKLATRVDIGSVGFGLSGRVHLKDVYIEDRTKDTLISGGTIKANVALFKLLSNEVIVEDLRMEDITAKIKRVLPDTVFNFQFIVDAFAPTTTTVDTTTTSAPMKLALDKFTLDNIVFQLNDDVTGNNMRIRIGGAEARMDSINPAAFYYDIPSIKVSDLTATIKQTKPLLTPEPASKDIAEAAAPAPMQLRIGTVDLSKIVLDYANDVSALYTTLNLGHLKTTGRRLDLTNNTVHLEDLILENTTAAVRMGKTIGAQVVKEEAAQEVAAEQTQGWDFRVGSIRLNNNNIKFDDDNQPRLSRGMDFTHLDAKALTLHADDFIMSKDSIATRITRGEMQEQSGFNLQELRGDLLYAFNGAHLKDLYIKTPGTELKRSLVLKYSSYEALTKNFPQTGLDIDIADSRVQVADILIFAPQLAAQPAFKNPSDIWNLNLQATGNMEALRVGSLRFNGFGATSIDASGTLANLTDPAKAGADFTIRRLHTTKSDLNMLSGGALPPTINLPASIDLDGTLKGNAGNLATALNLRTSAGSAAINGRFSNITDPAKARYDATVRASGLRLGSILANPQLGNLTGTFSAAGTGLTPETMNLKFSGAIASAGFNGYNYRNITAKGTLKGTDFSATLNSRDANAAFAMEASGDYGGTPSIKLAGMIDSLKLMPLGFTTEPFIFRGKIDGELPSVDPNALVADVRITQALLVAGTNRLSLDTLQLTAGRTDSGQFVRVASNILNASLEGQYQLTELGTVIQSNIQPYFSFGPPVALPQIKPYDFTFSANLVYDPVLATFVPGLNAADGLKAEGRMATGQGMQATVTAPYILFGTNEIRDVNLSVNTADSMAIRGVVGLVKSGTAIQMHNVQLNAAALANNLNFDLSIDDQGGKTKYTLGGLLQMPKPGDMIVSLRPGNLLLNYDQWTIPANNSITINDGGILAQAFVLQKGTQSLSLQSQGTGANAPLDVRFANFSLSTITGFVQQDSLLVDGTLNGIATINNLMTSPTFTSDLTLSDLSFQKDTLGNLAMKVSSEGSRYNANVTLTGRGNDLAITGYAEQAGEAMNLNLDLAIRKIELASLEGAAAGFLTQASGSVSGDVAIRGTTAAPDIQGEVEFNDASISTTLLGGPLRIDDEAIAITQRGILFDNFTIRDSANNRLDLNGDVLTEDFLSYRFDLDVEARNFKAVNSTKKDNKLFYGDMVISSNLHIGGTQTAPVIDGALTINEGTNFSAVLPQAEPGVVQREGIIQFVDFDAPANDSLFLSSYDSLNTSSILGFDIAVNLEIEKEAVFNLVVDEANGDFLNVKGAAQLSAGIDPSGKITMVGTYEIEEGAYELSFNFLRRRFEIQKGSKLTWLGEPTNAQVDVTGVYIANTAPLDLVENLLTEPSAVLRNRYLQKLPFRVLLQMDGELMKPEITFDIVLPTDQNYNVASDVISTVDTRLTQLRQEPSELNKQVFAVLLLNRFVGENPFASSGEGFNAGAMARQSVSKLLTEQLNQLTEGLINGVDLNFDVTSASDYTTGERRDRTDLNVGLSKRLLNDRLQVTVGSNFELEGPQQSGQRSNNIAGNVSLQYQLSRDGRYMLRAYRKNEYQGVVDGYIIETGLGFIITLDYNHFHELFRKKKKEPEQPITERNDGNNTDSTQAQ